LYRLLANPEYLEPLREEVDAVMKEEGWTKAGMDKMNKIDSFLRETKRLDGLAVRSLDSPLSNYEILIRSPLLPSSHEPSRVAPVHIFQR
jgi:hypothetical protein